MVVYNRRQLLKHALSHGSKAIKGSNQKVLKLHGLGIIPLGQGLYTFGSFNSTAGGMTPFGGGMSLFGTGFFSKIKKLASPLIKKGKDIVLSSAKSQLSDAASKIKNPALRNLAQKGIDTGADLVDSAMKGNKDLAKYGDIFKKGVSGATPELSALANQGTLKGLQLLNKKIAPKPKGRGSSNNNLAVTDSAPTFNTNKVASASNKQLTILRDYIQSAPIKGKGLKRM
jgi:hypothetical protein